MGGRRNKRRSKAGSRSRNYSRREKHGSRDVCGIVPEPENKHGSSEEAEIEFPSGVENNSPLAEEAEIEFPSGVENNRPLTEVAETEFPSGVENNRPLAEEAEIEFPSGVENNRPLAFGCSDCRDFELDLAKASLEYLQKRDEEAPKVFEELKVLGASFLCSWVRYPSSRFSSTDICHISFSAKPYYNGCDGVSPVWFFAELVEVEGEFKPALCKILNPTVTENTHPHQAITYGCGFCPKDKKFPHPPEEISMSFMKNYRKRDIYKNTAVDFKHHHRPFKGSEGSKDEHREGEERGLSELEAAKIVLTLDKTGSQFEVKEVVYMEKMPFFWVEIEGTSIWYHMGFTATAKNSCRPYCFFGELKIDAGEDYFVPVSCILLNTGDDSGLPYGCGFCPRVPPFVHPRDGYSCGAWEDPPPLDLTDQSDYD